MTATITPITAAMKPVILTPKQRLEALMLMKMLEERVEILPPDFLPAVRTLLEMNARFLRSIT